MLFLSLYQSILTPLLAEWIDDCALCILDTAMCSHKHRSGFLLILTKCNICTIDCQRGNRNELYEWIILRDLGIKRLNYNTLDSFASKLIPNITKGRHMLSLENSYKARTDFDGVLSVDSLKSGGSVDLILSIASKFCGLISMDISSVQGVSPVFWKSLASTCPLIRTVTVNKFMSILSAFLLPELQTIHGCDFVQILTGEQVAGHQFATCDLKRTDDSSSDVMCIEGKHFFITKLAANYVPKQFNACLISNWNKLSHLETLSITDTLAGLSISAISQHLTSFICPINSLEGRWVQGVLQNAPLLTELNTGKTMLMSIDFVKTVCKSCPLLETLSFTGLSIIENVLLTMFDCCKRLTKVQLNKSYRNNISHFSDATVRHLAVGLTTLKLVGSASSLKGITRSDKSLGIASRYITGYANYQRLFARNSNLTILTLMGLKMLTDYKLMQITRECPLLTVVVINGCKRLTTTGYNNLIACSHIRKLSLAGQLDVTDAFLLPFMQNHPNLVKLDLNGSSGFTTQCLSFVAQHCRELRYLFLYQSNVESKDVIALLENCLRLDSLSLSHCKLVDAQILPYLAKRKRMRYVTLTGTRMTKKEYEEMLLASGFSCTYILSFDYGYTPRPSSND